MNKNNTINISPILWGPLMWNLLGEVAKFGINNGKYLTEMNELIRCLPYVLPCHTCRNHAMQAYESGKVSKNINSSSKFKDWVWKMKTIANENTGASNISLDSYIKRLNARSSLISDVDLWDLLFMMSYSYPDVFDKENRKKYYVNFLKSLSNIVVDIPKLSKFAFLKNVSTFSNNVGFQEWLKSEYILEYNVYPDLSKYL